VVRPVPRREGVEEDDVARLEGIVGGARIDAVALRYAVRVSGIEGLCPDSI